MGSGVVWLWCVGVGDGSRPELGWDLAILAIT